jgi:DNA-binding CsgD family transcriptional regulator
MSGSKSHEGAVFPGPFVPSAQQIERVGDLSDMQRRCVELVSVGPSKVIAQHLGISHNTVDEYLKEACRRLGVRTRFQAATTAAAANAQAGLQQSTPLPQTWGFQTAPIAPDDQAGMLNTSDRTIDAERGRGRVRNAGFVGSGATPPLVTEQSRSRDSKRDRVSLARTLTRVLAYALVLAILAAAAVSIGSGFNAIGNFIESNVRHH